MHQIPLYLPQSLFTKEEKLRNAIAKSLPSGNLTVENLTVGNLRGPNIKEKPCISSLLPQTKLTLAPGLHDEMRRFESYSVVPITQI